MGRCARGWRPCPSSDSVEAQAAGVPLARACARHEPAGFQEWLYIHLPVEPDSNDTG